jgi:hypothetical protein
VNKQLVNISWYLERENEIIKNSALVQKQLTQRKGCKLELAGASVLQFPTGQFGFSYLPKRGVWLTHTCTRYYDEYQIEFGALARYIVSSIPLGTNKNLDFGAKFLLERDRFSIKGEYIYRFQSDYTKETQDGLVITQKTKTQDFKFVLKADYKLTDTIQLSYSFGQNFDVNLEFN